MKTLTAKNRQQWRAWLQRHHQKEKEMWLMSYKKHTGKPTIPYLDALKEALCFGWIDTLVKRIDDERYATRFTPRRLESQWSATNVKLYRALERAGLMTEAGRKAFKNKAPLRAGTR